MWTQSTTHSGIIGLIQDRWEKPQVFPKEVTEVSELYVYIYIYITYIQLYEPSGLVHGNTTRRATRQRLSEATKDQGMKTG